ncbi:MAG TPA: hypothetical protein VK667_07415, partial [Ktedonobacteraceae bacterium]|nr:hypothetical protein [Ktedonobacteraceae bacterium]
MISHASAISAAVSAMEVIQQLNKHVKECRQCSLDPNYCATRKQYQENFQRDYDQWERLTQE